jgi:hypothetical protein
MPRTRASGRKRCRAACPPRLASGSVVGHLRPSFRADLSITNDAYVKLSTPTTSYVTDSVLKVGTSNGGTDKALLMFPALDATYRGNSNPIDVQSATLNLYQMRSGSRARDRR